MQRTLSYVFSLLLLSLFIITLNGCSKSGVADSAPSPVPPPSNPPPPTVKKWVVSTLAGSVKGSVDGNGGSAAFNMPFYLYLKGDTLYVVDIGTYSIRKVTLQGDVSTFVVNIPLYDIAVDQGGTVFTSNLAGLQKVYSATDIIPFAGGVPRGRQDGPGTTARFWICYNFAIDQFDNFIVPDLDTSYKLSIRKVSASGTVSTLPIHDYTRVPAEGDSILAVHAITVDTLTGNIYVSDDGSRVIKKITPEGEVSILAGANHTDFGFISDLAVDPSGYVWVADQKKNGIFEVSPEGIVTRIAGAGDESYQDGEGSQALFNTPVGLAIDANGVVYVADEMNNRIRKIEYK